jgi:hypothetical protein
MRTPSERDVRSGLANTFLCQRMAIMCPL